jgi:hypothetical protein
MSQILRPCPVRFVIYPVAQFCPWDPGEVEELDAQNTRYVTETSVAEWLRVAQVSTKAVGAHPGGWEMDHWHQFGAGTGLTGDASNRFDSLYIWPIMVSPDQWTNGRHRALLIERAGATHLAWLTRTRFQRGSHNHRPMMEVDLEVRRGTRARQRLQHADLRRAVDTAHSGRRSRP